MYIFIDLENYKFSIQLFIYNSWVALERINVRTTLAIL